MAAHCPKCKTFSVIQGSGTHTGYWLCLGQGCQVKFWPEKGTWKQRDDLKIEKGTLYGQKRISAPQSEARQFKGANA